MSAREERAAAVRLWTNINTVLAAVIVVAVVAGGWFGWGWYSNTADNDNQEDAVAAATQVSEALFSASAATLDEDIAKVKDMAVGVFATEFEANMNQVREDVMDTGANRTVEILSAAYVSRDITELDRCAVAFDKEEVPEDVTACAVVLLSLDTVTTAQNPPDEEADPSASESPEGDESSESTETDGARTDHYRVRALMVMQDDAWLIAGLEIA